MNISGRSLQCRLFFRSERLILMIVFWIRHLDCVSEKGVGHSPSPSFLLSPFPYASGKWWTRYRIPCAHLFKMADSAFASKNNQRLHPKRLLCWLKWPGIISEIAMLNVMYLKTQCHTHRFKIPAISVFFTWNLTWNSLVMDFSIKCSSQNKASICPRQSLGHSIFWKLCWSSPPPWAKTPFKCPMVWSWRGGGGS